MHHRQIRANGLVFLIPNIRLILHGTVHILQSGLVLTHGLQKRLLQIARTMRLHDFLVNVLRRMQIILLTPNVGMGMHKHQRHRTRHLRVPRKPRGNPLTRDRIVIQGIGQLQRKRPVPRRLLQLLLLRTKPLASPSTLRHFTCKFRERSITSATGTTLPHICHFNLFTQARSTSLRHFLTTTGQRCGFLLQPCSLSTRTTPHIIGFIGRCLLTCHDYAPLLKIVCLYKNIPCQRTPPDTVSTHRKRTLSLDEVHAHVRTAPLAHRHLEHDRLRLELFTHAITVHLNQDVIEHRATEVELGRMFRERDYRIGGTFLIDEAEIHDVEDFTDQGRDVALGAAIHERDALVREPSEIVVCHDCLLNRFGLHR
nr:MAG TPA: hypothetical protein [Bacteriophage sp.]